MHSKLIKEHLPKDRVNNEYWYTRKTDYFEALEAAYHLFDNDPDARPPYSYATYIFK